MPEQIGLKSSFYIPKHTHADDNNGGKLNAEAAIHSNTINLGILSQHIIGTNIEANNTFKFFEKTFSGVKTSNTNYTSLWTFTARANIYFTIEFNVASDTMIDPGYACIRDGTTIISPEYTFNYSGLIQKFTKTTYYEMGKTYNIALKSDDPADYAYLLSVKFYGFSHPTYGGIYLYQYCVSPPAPALTS
ncbi:MAG TPA: hypothetical protein P5562_00820 [Candidatus Woesebacteria bacterium]|nr:hypothetical protein [Candidatus Woesebacteria bacterium]